MRSPVLSERETRVDGATGTTAPGFASLNTGLHRRAVRAYAGIAGLIDRLQSPFAFALRLYVGRVFFASGLIKLSDWNATLALFANEYHVPVLSPHLAAILGTAAEVGLPVFLALGLGTRFAAVALFVFNIVAATSYPDLSPAGLKDHILWGALMTVIFFYGPGWIALDAWIAKKLEYARGE
jgi:putative oxidoreductase